MMVCTNKHPKRLVIDVSFMRCIERHSITEINVLTLLACMRPKYALDLTLTIELEVRKKLRIFFFASHKKG